MHEGHWPFRPWICNLMLSVFLGRSVWNAIKVTANIRTTPSITCCWWCNYSSGHTGIYWRHGFSCTTKRACCVADLDIMDKPPRSPQEGLVSPWTFVRWMVVGFYVGFATVAAFAFWYMYDNVLGIDLSQDGHSIVTWYQLTHYNQCSDWPDFQVCGC